MQPFLLAFIDSQAFQIIGGLLLLPLVLAAAAATVLLLRLTRAGLRRRQQQRVAKAVPSGWQRLTLSLQLLPAAIIGLVALLLGIGALLDAIQNRQRATGFEAALHRQETRLLPQAAGRYVLADSALPTPNPTWYMGKNDWELADTTLLSADRANHGRPPYVELLLRPDGTFTYHSTIAGDAAGKQAAGHWQLQAGYVDVHTVQGLRDLHDYTLVFDGFSPLTSGEAPLSGSLAAHYDKTVIYLAGAYLRGNNLLRFVLKKAPDEVVQAPMKTVGSAPL